MTRLTAFVRRPTLADRLFGRGTVTDAVLILTGTALTSIAAQVIIPVWPIPITGQTVAVLLVGMALGAARGAISMVLYVALGAAGLPIFSNSASGVEWLAGGTGGYILGFVGAAALVGWVAERGLDRTLWRSIASAAAGTAAIYLVGLPGLALTRSLSVAETLETGFYPLVLGGVVKLLVAALVNTASWSAVARMEAREARRSSNAM